jgi:hypothetical protein
MKFYKVTLTPIPKDKVLEYAYERFGNDTRTLDAIRNGKITLADRIGNGKCEVCGKSDWMILPLSFKAVQEGGKPYIQCTECGTITHL